MIKSKKRSPTKEPVDVEIPHPNTYNDNATASKDMIWVDPTHVRFQHSKIRPVFSSCGRTLMETLNSIRSKEILPTDLPPIHVVMM